jgi:hypothetical protein
VIDNRGRGELLDVPVLVHLRPDRITYNLCEPGGVDLRFVAADGVTELSHEIDEWDSAGDSFIWVKVPRLAAGSATGYVYMYYDRDGATPAQSAADVWSNGYVAVYHMGADLNDSSAGAHHGQAGGSSTLSEAAGRIGQGRSFNGVNDYVALPDEAAFDLVDGLSISLWFQVQRFDARYQTLIAKGMQAWQLARDDNNSSLGFGTASAADQSLDWLSGSADVSGGGWFMATAVYDADQSDRLLYIDADEDASDNFNPALNNSDDPVQIGENAAASGRSFAGVIDEVRVSSTARSADWISAQHASMSDLLITYAAQDEIP